MGAVHALTLKLGYILMSRTNPQTTTTTAAAAAGDSLPSADTAGYPSKEKEIESVCQCLYRVLDGCAADRKVRSWQEMGPSELIPLLLQILQQFQASLTTVRDTVRVLRVFGKLSVAKPALIRFPGLTVTCISLLMTALSEDDPDTTAELLGAVKDWSFRSRPQDKELLYQTQGLRQALVHVQQHHPQRQVNHARLKEYTSAIWWNLALVPSVASDMTHCDDLVASLKENLIPNDDTLLKTRRNTLSVLGNLASVPTNQEKLASDVDLWNHLRSVSLLDDDTDCRRRAVRTVRCLSAHEAFQQPGLLKLLIHVATNDKDRDTRVQALETIGNLQLKETDMSSILSLVEQAMDAETTLSACKLLLSSTEASNSSSPCQQQTLSPSFFQNLQQLVEGIPTIESHQVVTKCIALSIQDPSKALQSSSATLLLNTLAILVGKDGMEFESTRQQALGFVQELATADDNNRRPMAEHEALLSSIVNFALYTPDGHDKDQAKGLLLNLVPEL